MRFYNVEMKGKFKLDPQTSLPPHDPNDEGRLMYYNGTLYYTDSTAQTVISTTGGGAASGNAALLEGNSGGYYLCRDNHTGCNDADLLNGQLPSYYNDMANATGVLAVENGGTGATDSTGFVANMQLDTCYGRLGADNIWSGSQCWYQDYPGYWWQCTNLSLNCLFMYYCNCSSAYCSCTRISTGGISMRGIYNQTACIGAGGMSVYYNSCSTGSPGCGIVTVYTDRCCCNAAFAAALLVNNRPDGAGAGLEVCNCAECHAVWARSCAATNSSICAEALGGGSAVSGNTAYANTSSQYLKHLECACLSDCVRKNPLSIYKYYWEDANNAGFNMTIGPTAEDFHKTFNLDNSQTGEEYDAVWSLDGAALGLAVENLKEIDTLKKIVVQLYSCIQKLEGSEG